MVVKNIVMKILKCLILSFSSMLLSQVIVAKEREYPYEFSRRAEELYAKNDTVFICNSGGSYVLPPGRYHSGYIIYRKNNQWRGEIHVWNSSSGKLVAKRRIKKSRQKDMCNIFHIIYTYYNTLEIYNNHKVLGNHPVITGYEGDTQIVTANQSNVYSFFYYKAKMGNQIYLENYIEKARNITEINSRYPMLGFFLTTVRLFHYDYSTDNLW